MSFLFSILSPFNFSIIMLLSCDELLCCVFTLSLDPPPPLLFGIPAEHEFLCD